MAKVKKIILVAYEPKLKIVNLYAVNFVEKHIPMKNYLFLLVMLLCFTACRDKKNTTSDSGKASYQSNPKLVVGIVVDQMRYDYLTRFWNKYGEGGFKRMVAEGFNCKNNHFNYVPTYTAPGHASVYTGTTPATHGIISNNWYDKFKQKNVYCVEDDNYESVGTTSDAGKMSPNKMITTTVTDQLRLATQMQAKVIGIAIKDRGAILPAGHTANAAYWFKPDNEGIFISSSYYMDELPDWVNAFNSSGKIGAYMQVWNTLYDINTYHESGPDDTPYEGRFKGEKAPVFPHDLPKLSAENDDYSILNTTPFGNSFTTDFAIAALDAEQLGKDEVTDFLAVSFSSTDYVGHKYGPNSKEVEDTYIRLDKDLERLFKALDEKTGKGNYTVFLTADHAVVHVPAYLQSVNIFGAYFNYDDFEEKVAAFLQDKYGINLIEDISNNQIFLKLNELKRLKLNPAEVETAIAREIITYNNINKVYTSTVLQQTYFAQGMAHSVQNGYNQKRSGNVIFVLHPGILSTWNLTNGGTSHGTGYNYDTHVPLLFFGNGIQQGETTRRTEIPDIAPTISSLLNIAFPNGATGEPLSEVLQQKK